MMNPSNARALSLPAYNVQNEATYLDQTFVEPKAEQKACRMHRRAQARM